MKKRTDFLVYIAVLAIFALFLILGLQLEYLKAKQVPLIAVSIGLAAIAAGFISTAITKGELVEGDTIEGGRGKEGSLQGWRRYTIFAWLAVVYVSFFILGITIGSGLFTGAYMKFYGARWWVALLFTFITPAFVYLLFDVALGLYLYNGIFLPT